MEDQSEFSSADFPADEKNAILAAFDYSQDTMQNLLASGDVTAVFGEPVTTEFGQVIIPAAEILSSAGFALGTGHGPKKSGEGAGSGGGGHVSTRPVAVIIADKNGVRVEPVLDASKVVMTLLVTVGFVLGSWKGMSRPPKPPRIRN